MRMDKELLDQLMEGPQPGDLFGADGIPRELTKALAERALNTELDAHLTEERADPAPERGKPGPQSAQWNQPKDRDD